MKSVKYVILLVVVSASIVLIALWINGVKDVDLHYKSVFEKEEILIANKAESLEEFVGEFADENSKDLGYLKDVFLYHLNEKSGERELTTLLTLFAKNYSHFSQVILIDSAGYESIRIETDLEGNVTNVHELQLKKGRYYFQDAKALNNDEVYISPLDLNVEHGMIEKPYNPTIRFITPLYVDSVFFGVLGLNLRAQTWLSEMKEEGVIVLNANGERFNGDSVGLYEKFDTDYLETSSSFHGKEIVNEKKLGLTFIIDVRSNSHRAFEAISNYESTSFFYLILITLFVAFAVFYISYRIMKFSKKVVEINALNLRLEKANQDLKKLIDEKTTLIQEIHHRVKNNLQIVLSILRLKFDHLKTEEAMDLDKYIDNRVRAMSEIHALLYRSDNLSEINLKEYFEQLIPYVVDSLKVQDQKIDIKIDVPDCTVDINIAVPLGLLVTEIITNSVKHAFNKGVGELYFKLSRIDDQIEVIIGDNGVGISSLEEAKDVGNLGINLIESLTEQLDGEIALDNTKSGTTYILKFCKKDYSELK